MCDVVHKAERADDRRRLDRALDGLIVKADFAAYDRDVHELAIVDYGVYRLRECPEYFRVFRACKLQVVDDTDWLCPCAYHVSASFREAAKCTLVRVEVAVL